MTQKKNIEPFEVSFNPDDERFYLCDNSTEDGRVGIPVLKSNGEPAVYTTYCGATARARTLLAERKG